MASDDKAVIFRFKIDGVPEVANGATTMSSAMGQLTPASEKVKTAFGAMGKETDKTRIQVDSAKNSVMILAATLGDTVPALRPFQAGLSQVAGAAAGLSASLGVSAGSAAVAGGLLFGLKLFWDYTHKATEALKEFDAVAVKSIEHQEKLLKLQVEMGLQDRERLGLVKKLLAGQGEQADFDRARALSATLDKETGRAQINLTIQQIEELEKEAQAIGKVKEAQDEQFKSAEMLADGYSELADERKRAAGETKRLADEEERLEKAKFQKLISEEAQYFEPDLKTWAEQDKKDQLELSKQFSDREIEYANNVLRNFEENERRKQDIIEQTKQMQIDAAMRAGAVVATTGAKALQDLVKGKKLEAGAIIETIGDGLYADGISNALKAAAMAWIPGLNVAAAPGLAAAAAAEIAMGLAMGAAGARAAGGTTHEAREAGREPETAISRQRDQYESGTPAQQPNITIYMQTLNPTAEAGYAVADALNQAYQKNTSLRIERSLVTP